MSSFRDRIDADVEQRPATLEELRAVWDDVAIEQMAAAGDLTTDQERAYRAELPSPPTLPR